MAKHCHCNRGERHSKTHFIRHQYSWHISIPNLPPPDEPDCPNLVHQRLSSGQVWNWIRMAWNTVLSWLTNTMSIQQSGCLIKPLGLKLVLDCTENCIQYWAGICWIEDLLTILHLLGNVSCTFVCVSFFLIDLFQLLWCKLGWWAHILVLLKHITMFSFFTDKQPLEHI